MLVSQVFASQMFKPAVNQLFVPMINVVISVRNALMRSLQRHNRPLRRCSWMGSPRRQPLRGAGRRNLIAVSLWMLSCLVVLASASQPAHAAIGSSASGFGLNSLNWPLVGATATLLLAIIVVLNLLTPSPDANAEPNPLRRWIKRLLTTLIDAETQTYSLSRLQFYLWTAVALWSYCYFMLALVFVQHKPQFVDVPAGLPSMVTISASTTIFSAGITAVKGSKGSGQILPSPSDLISAGGNVVPERIQLLAWTLVGVGAYLLLVIEQGPAEISALPTIPDGFLQLSGISSLGYLGGKLARNPGPVITAIDPAHFDPGTQVLTLVIKGQNLSSSAGFRVAADAAGTLLSVPGPDVTDVMVNLKNTSASTSGSAGAASTSGDQIELKFTAAPMYTWPAVDDNGAEILYSLSLINPDGQKADWKFKGVA